MSTKKVFRKIKHRMWSKTYLSALLLGAITAVDLNTGLVSGLFPQEYRPWLLMAWPVLMMTLREMTNSALGDDKPNKATNAN